MGRKLELNTFKWKFRKYHKEKQEIHHIKTTPVPRDLKVFFPPSFPSYCLHYAVVFTIIFFGISVLIFLSPNWHGFTCDSWGTLWHEHRTCDMVSSHSHCGVSHRLCALATWPLIISTAATSAVHWCIIVIVRRWRPIVPADHRHLSILGLPRRYRKRVRRKPFTILKKINNEHFTYTQNISFAYFPLIYYIWIPT